MKKIIIFFALVFLSSCEIPYDGENRLVVEAQIFDSSGNPISDQYVKIQNTTGYDIISFGKTNSQGKITLIFPSKEDTKFAVQVGYDNDPIYTKKILSNLQLINFVNYKIKLDPITLYKNEEVTTLSLEFIHSSSNTELKDIKIEGLVADEHFYFNPVEPSNYYYPQNQFDIVKNQNFLLIYTVTDFSTGTDTTYSVNLTVVNDPINYTITY